MLSYVAQRLASMLAVMFLVATTVFVIVRLTPGDPAVIMLGPEATIADIEAMRTRLGLDEPIVLQYGLWLGQVLQGDLGRSIFLDQPVTEALLSRAEPTFFLTLFAVLIAVAIGVPVGILSAVSRGTALDQAVTGLAILGASVPSFWLGLIMIQFFAVRLGWFEVAGYGGPGASLADRLQHLVLPAIVLGLLSSAQITRFTRASMLDVLGEDFIRTARSKGLPERVVISKHALRNALVPILTVIGVITAILISGAVVTETLFGLPGVGNLVVTAVLRRDYPVLQGAMLAIAALYVLINLAIDLLYMLVDPRIRY